MEYPGHGFKRGSKPTITSLENGKDTGMELDAQRIGLSSMDVYEICKRYNCGRCAKQAVSNYEGVVYKTIMKRCSGDNERYYWQSRCHDQFFECDRGDDELSSNSFCNPCL